MLPSASQSFKLAGYGAISLLVFKYLARVLRNYLLKKETIVLDLPDLGKAREDEKKIKGTAVICGGSIAGLLAARVCHDHFEKVIIVESEAWLCTEDAKRADSWNQENKRARIMQYQSTHGYMLPVTDGLLRLFPLFEKECNASEIRLLPLFLRVAPAGHILMNPIDEYGGILPKTTVAGRRGLETLLRRLTLNEQRYPNIKQVAGTVTGMSLRETTGKSKDITKITIRTEEGINQEIDAALVIDCTGPARAGEKWLRHAGIDLSEGNLTESYDALMHYVTFNLSIPPALALKALGPSWEEHIDAPSIFVYKGDARKNHKFIASAKAESNSFHNGWNVTVSIVCGNWGGTKEDLPNDINEAREHLRQVESVAPIPEWIWKFFDLCQEPEIQESMQISKVRVPPSYWTHFEEAGSQLPSNWIALGDVVSRVNPVYGQGVGKAMLGVVSLNNVLHYLHTQDVKSIPSDFSSRVFRAQADKIAPLWMGNKMIDYAYNTTIPKQGESLDKGAYIRWYLRGIEELCGKDKQIGSVMWHSLQSRSTSIDIFHPFIIAKILFNALVS
ncbi:hypothetical protein D9758_009295 [Tetrapyrgos nigripes]|uniref:Uncharacterized protein n=1 Tax=Tetrapyrgos nigripes TaxID=182062 RepID=A0A8H5GGV4_9AGAR|nr:hypothetical protein D9758_009295 [Tetrapyrgos nigripes]